MINFFVALFCYTFSLYFRLLRAALASATMEFDKTVKREKEMVKRLGGLYVIGTSRQERMFRNCFSFRSSILIVCPVYFYLLSSFSFHVFSFFLSLLRVKSHLFILFYSIRHESRRIDNQLRGRAGRQGDPGNCHLVLLITI